MFKRLTENWVLKVLSLVFALVLWFFVIGERRLEVGYAVPLELKNVPEGMMVANEVPSLVDVRISGPRTLLMNLRPTDINISVDLKDLSPGLTSFKRLEERLNIPSGLKVTRLSPSFVDVKLDRVGEKQVPVRVVSAGTPAEGFRVAALQAEPGAVSVSGAEGELRDVHEAVTETVSVDGVREGFSLMVPVNYRGKFTRLQGPATVEVRVAVEPVAEEKPRRKQR